MNKKKFANLFREAIHSISFNPRSAGKILPVRQEMADVIRLGEATIEKWSRHTNPVVPNFIDPGLLERITDYCIGWGRLDRRWAHNFLTYGGYPEVTPPGALETFLNSRFPLQKSVQPRVILCYQRDQVVDAELARKINFKLTRFCQIWEEPPYTIDPGWEEGLSENLRTADFIIVLISAAAEYGGEMIRTVIEKGNLLAEISGQAVRWLPIRVQHRHRFGGLFAQHFDALNWDAWESEADTAGLLDRLEAVLMQRAAELPLGPTEKEVFLAKAADRLPEMIPPSPKRFVINDGAIDFESDFYLERAADRRTVPMIRQQNVTIVVKGPSQMGKSSLLLRLKREAEAAGKRVAYLNFGTLRSRYESGDEFFQEFLAWLLDEAALSYDFEKHPMLPITRDITKYMERAVLPALAQNLVLMIDSADSLFCTPYCEDFFSMLRGWHNNRANRIGPGQAPVWRKLDLVLATSTEEYLHILDKSRSPFNVGQVVELEDFSTGEVVRLNELYQRPFTQEELDRLMGYLSGHPYLTRRGMYEVASGNVSAARFFETILEEDGPFGEHLRSLHLRMTLRPDVVRALEGMVRGEPLAEPIYWLLKGAGLVERSGGPVGWRRRLYEIYFSRLYG